MLARTNIKKLEKKFKIILDRILNISFHEKKERDNQVEDSHVTKGS